MKLVYFFTRRHFGKVLTPLKVHAARLRNVLGKSEPTGQKAHAATGVGDAHPASGARINICLFCIDIARSFTIKASMNQAKFDALDEYGTSPVFNDAERAALDYVTELTKDKKVSPETFTRMSRHYSEREICEIVWLVASEHLYNMTNIVLTSIQTCSVTRQKEPQRSGMSVN
jgi:alkylhydroperoxidase family enzyme